MPVGLSRNSRSNEADNASMPLVRSSPLFEYLQARSAMARPMGQSGPWTPIPPELLTLEGQERLAESLAKQLGIAGTERDLVRIYERFVPPDRDRIARIDVDVPRFDTHFARAGMSLYVGPGGTAAADQDSYARCIRHLRAPGAPLEASLAHLTPEGIVFTNGRHRYALLRDLGFERIPIHIPTDELKAFLRAGLIVAEPWSLPLLSPTDLFNVDSVPLGQDLVQLGLDPEASRLLAGFGWDRVVQVVARDSTHSGPTLSLHTDVFSSSFGSLSICAGGSRAPSLFLPLVPRPIDLTPPLAALVLSRLEGALAKAEVRADGSPDPSSIIGAAVEALRTRASEGSGRAGSPPYDVTER